MYAIMALLEVIAGLVLLVFAGDALVRGAVTVAERLGVPALIISLTIIAFGTSAPELLVGIDAVLAGSPTLALGNVVGSNIANVLLVVGLPALILPVACTASRLGRNYAFMLFASLFMMFLAHDGVLTFSDSLILTTGLFSFLAYSAVKAQSARRELRDAANAESGAPEGFATPVQLQTAGTAALNMCDHMTEEEDTPEEDVEAVENIWLAVAMLLGGLIGLALGADLLVDGSVTIARNLGVSEAIIGLTLVAIGTSLPELVTALTAAFKKHSDVAVGSVVGSNIFNLLGILGISGMVGDIPVPNAFIEVDLLVMLGASLLLAPYIFAKKQVGKLVGLFMVIAYVTYLLILAA